MQCDLMGALGLAAAAGKPAETKGAAESTIAAEPALAGLFAALLTGLQTPPEPAPPAAESGPGTGSTAPAGATEPAAPLGASPAGLPAGAEPTTAPPDAAESAGSLAGAFGAWVGPVVIGAARTPSAPGAVRPLANGAPLVESWSGAASPADPAVGLPARAQAAAPGVSAPAAAPAAPAASAADQSPAAQPAGEPYAGPPAARGVAAPRAPLRPSFAAATDRQVVTEGRPVIAAPTLAGPRPPREEARDAGAAPHAPAADQAEPVRSDPAQPATVAAAGAPAAGLGTSPAAAALLRAVQGIAYAGGPPGGEVHAGTGAGPAVAGNPAIAGAAAPAPGATVHATGPLASEDATSARIVDPERIQRQVVQQLLRAERATGDSQRLTLRLEPEQLGKVEVRLVAHGDRLEVVFQAETPAAEQALRDGAQELARTLASQLEGRWQQVEVRLVESAPARGTAADPDDSEDDRTGGGDRRDGHDQRRRQRRQPA